MTSATTPPSAADRNGEIDDRRTLSELYALLAKCFVHPDEPFHRAVRSGEFETAVRDRLERLDSDSTPSPAPSAEESHADLRRAYLQTFEGFDGPSAPPVESVYEPWWDGRERELLSGPAEADAKRRFEAIDADRPDAYPADHLAVLLEYASLALEAERDDEYADFHARHFDWLSAFADRVTETADAPFYEWAVEVLEVAVLTAKRRYLDGGTAFDRGEPG
ncbi:TorD/DmsD family molecular chaperone [Natronobacterium gregoryi]|uniref:Component of anaerobic dehydrogenase n=2 Tax=Natronobacterium gregoryi TaxID=44930 RepID=L0AFH1_NATGS|nr:molecular chaperone TorD family protein [Natronobacterium gregoryi]AFZ71805.1 putative component of anaerobic dehydrogenase [Natronobacterium gregoryi SP2]ELY72964.1 hypothetical protein C490_02256 [Natronobacterium gregoryi SP2]PLK21014.1 hypothetical protein CYV19_06155 [Natronobacterium gregoryi SP2]SFI87412.1 chaperone TorD involved in molybdoenzyme TorA maturation [Natronobacterium gregoryi]